jgi:thymidylate synthase (FAD)
MNVKLLQSNPQGEHLAYIGAATCVGKANTPSVKGFQHAVESGHYSILEHLPMTFLIENVSRSLTHQLVRHRIASYSQESQRYTKVNSGVQWFVIPDSYVEKGLFEEYLLLMDTIANFYHMSVDAGIPKEDARFVLPNAAHTTILMTMNARTFIEVASKRLCNRAQWEIRDLFYKMREQIKDVYPTVYELAKPPCASGGCTEHNPCGNPWV